MAPAFRHSAEFVFFKFCFSPKYYQNTLEVLIFTTHTEAGCNSIEPVAVSREHFFQVRQRFYFISVEQSLQQLM